MRPHLRRALGALKGRLLGRFSRGSYSQEGEDMVLRRIFDRRREGFYVDVGAHHPLRYSNTYFFYRLGWHGITIEPNPDVALAFRLLRPRDVHLTVGIAESAGKLTYFSFDDPALNTFDADLALQRQRAGPYAMTGEREVPVERLDTLLDRHLPSGTPIDFLSVDVEGLDLAVLCSNDWARFRPRCVLAEALGISFESLAQTELARFLRNQGYRPFAKCFNTVFFQESEWIRPQPM